MPSGSPSAAASSGRVDTAGVRAYPEWLEFKTSEIHHVFVPNRLGREVSPAPVVVGVIIIREVRP